MGNDPTGKMKLSNAMRLADEMGLPEVRCKLVDTNLDNWIGEKPPCCALGGAVIAAGELRLEAKEFFRGKIVEEIWRSEGASWEMMFEVPRGRTIDCPDENGCQSYSGITSTITHLFDDHEWTRTQIADWLDELDD